MRPISFKVVLLAATSFILTVLTLVVGAPFIKTLRKNSPIWFFWLVGLVFSTAAGPLWFFIAIPWLAVGVSTELELRGVHYLKSAFLTTILLTLLAVAGVLVLKLTGTNFETQLEQILELMVSQIKKMNPQSQISVPVFVEQLPSFFVGSVIMILATASAFERPVHAIFRLPYNPPQTLGDYFTFKVPAWAFWLSLISMALMVLPVAGSPWVATVGLNMVNIFMIIYFIQGALIAEYYLRATQAGLLWRIFVYFIMMGPLVLGIVGVGFVDFWLDFRVRIQKLLSVKREQE
ncbi:MAG: DUF2232 domain-containing protein [Bdellovibrionota bacterium]